MYLHFFEQIVLAEVVNLGGSADWALPYWNYSFDEASRLLPEAFRNTTLPDGSPNFLYVARRDPRCNQGTQFADDQDVELRSALVRTLGNFSVERSPHFGGVASGFSHNGTGLGMLEITPHGTMHVAVGGVFVEPDGQRSRGWMGAFNTAPLDPIFWLHHANLDRLWQVWLDRDSRNQNPIDLQWLNNVKFSFHDATGQKVERRCLDVVDTNALDYTYDDVSDPFPAPAPGMPLPLEAIDAEEAMSDGIPPELVGASETNINVGNSPARVRVPMPAHDAALAHLEAMGASEPRILLQLENLTCDGPANSYDVYVNVPDAEDPTRHRERFAGRLDLFGIAEASRATDQHPGSGLTYTLDISGIYHDLSTEQDWDPENLDVSLVPVRQWDGDTVNIGRVSVFFA